MNRRPTHIQDWLCQQRTGQWFGFSGAEQTYDQLIIHGDYEKPTEQECIDGLAQMQADFDAKDYQRSRAAEYPSLAEQLDYIYHNGVEAWKTDIIDPIKTRYPKP